MKFTPLSALLIIFYLSPAFSIQLQDLEWQSRVLLIFVPDHSDQRWQATRARLNQFSCDLDDRNIVLGKFYSKGESTIAGQLISSDYNQEVRRNFQIADQDYTVVLLGKDGKEYYRSLEVPTMQSLFSLIDQMPMRRIEVKHQAPACH